MLGTYIEVLRKESFTLNILQPLITYSRKLRFIFFVEQLVQSAAAQFGNINIKRNCFFRCLTSTLMKTWNMHTVFSEVYFISDRQIFQIMKFLNAMTS